jgi:hypothetical protein
MRRVEPATVWISVAVFIIVCIVELVRWMRAD